MKLTTYTVIEHFKSLNVRDQLGRNQEIYVGLHLHRSRGMEIGDVEAISPLAFDYLASSYMKLFSDIFDSSTSVSVTEFEVREVFQGVLLCKCLGSGILFTIEYSDFLIFDFEDNIYYENPDFEDDLSQVSPEIRIHLLVNMTFNLDMDFIYVDKFENIGESITLIQDILNKHA
jgi:hypothetical protein